MAKTATRRRRQPAATPKPRAGRTKTPKPASIPSQATACEEPGLMVRPQADPRLADAADRAADIRDQADDDAARLLTDAADRAAGLLDGARAEAATITKAASADQARALADAEAAADQVRTDAEAKAEQLLADARVEADGLDEAATGKADELLADAAKAADRVRAEAAKTAAADADQVRTDAEAKAQELLADAQAEAGRVTEAATTAADQVLADARHRADEVVAEGTAKASELRTDAGRDAARLRAGAEGQRTELLAAAERAAAETRTRAAEEAEKARAEAAAEAEQQLHAARSEAARLREDAGRELEAATADAARARKLAEEDVARVRATAAEDAERLTRTAREEADRILAVAKEKSEAGLREAETVLAQARVRESDAEVTLKAADDALAEAAAQMQRATSRTEKALARKQLKHQARQERRDEKTARKATARETRDARRAGQPTPADRAKKFVKVNAERLMVVGPITAPMAVAWTGQAGFAKDILGWVAPWTILFAAAWELSTAFVGWMYHQSRRSGDAGTLYRASTWVFAAGAAVMNFWHASGAPKPGAAPVFNPDTHEWVQELTYWHFTPKAVAFAAMSIVGMVLWELYASLIHRRKLREDGKVAKARPTIGAVRWVRYPVHSFTAWSLAITDASLTTLDRAWTAAGAQLADRKAVRTGRTLHRVVVPRIGTDDHGPAAIPTVLTITRMDRPGPFDSLGPVRPVQRDRYPVRSGPDDRHAVHGPVRSTGRPDRTVGPAIALEPGPTNRTTADLHGSAGPDRNKSVPAAHTAPTTRGVTVRTEVTDRTGPVDGPERNTDTGLDRGTDSGPDRTVITLTDLERTALDRLRTENRTLNRTNIAAAVRSEGGSIATDRAGQIAVALKQHTVH
ncbi:hypothetical protein [Streptomyces sp. MMS24-I29]|uniref:hypothetical protein n=1 Tax=Streptomyces sp. MMS24-I29 TaxID=3351480 RepID=UPI003C7A7EBE